MRTFLETEWGERYELAPLNFEQYARLYEPINGALGLVPRSAFDHWKMTNKYYEVCDLTLEQLQSSRIITLATPQEYEADQTPLPSPLDNG